MTTRIYAAAVAIAFSASASWVSKASGPYSAAANDPANTFDAPIAGFVGPHGEGKARIVMPDGSFQNPHNFVNPLFFGWAEDCPDYSPAPGVASFWQRPEQTLGPVTGDHFHIASLGDLSATQIANGETPGSITLSFSGPIRNKTGADFAVFENGFISVGGSGIVGQISAELAYVEVSSDGVHFARMPSRSLTPAPVGAYGTVNPKNVFGLAGKHVNAYGDSWGTPFDLAWLANDALVTGGLVNLDAITYIRLVDIPGDGTFSDSQGSPIFDAWLTWGSGGLDLEAIGVISRDIDFETWQDQRGLLGPARGAMADPDGDGIPNLLEYASALLPVLPDSYQAVQSLTIEAGLTVLRFRRDERATDLMYEVESSSDLQTWSVIARGTAGAPLQPVAPFAPAITETSASSIASIGVIRKVSVSEPVPAAQRRFLRLRVSRAP